MERVTIHRRFNVKDESAKGARGFAVGIYTTSERRTENIKSQAKTF